VKKPQKTFAQVQKAIILKFTIGESSDALLLPKGSFFQSTGGQWIFVVDPDGNQALKANIRIGKQNSRYYEVLEGLENGEKVITSNL